jgi:hypothetical protein
MVWKIPIYNTLLKMLTNPTYAGAYAFGKTQSRIRVVEGPRPPNRRSASRVVRSEVPRMPSLRPSAAFRAVLARHTEVLCAAHTRGIPPPLPTARSSSTASCILNPSRAARRAC